MEATSSTPTLIKPMSTSLSNGVTEEVSSSVAVTEDELVVGSYVVGSFPTDYQYSSADLTVADNGDVVLQHECHSLEDDKPKILLMGLRRSGKSSIQKVVFHKMSPNETLFIESTNKIVKDDVSECSFIKFSVWDFPGHIDFFDPTFEFESIFGNAGAIIFVIDAQDDYIESLTKLHITVTKAYKINRNIKFEVFIHKCDGLSDDSKIEMQRDVTQRATDDLLDAGFENVNMGFHLTTIYDHSVFEAFSKVVQKLIPHMAAFEGLLNIFCSNSALEKAFLFDIASKIYIATDTTAVDMQTYELCCDMIDVVIDVSSIYGCKPESESNLLSTISAGGLGSQIFSEQTAATIKLNNNTVLYMRGVNRHLALVCVMREEALERQGIIEYNFHCIKKGLLDLLELRSRNYLHGGVQENGTADFEQSADELRRATFMV